MRVGKAGALFPTDSNSVLSFVGILLLSWGNWFWFHLPGQISFFNFLALVPHQLLGKSPSCLASLINICYTKVQEVFHGSQIIRLQPSHINQWMTVFVPHKNWLGKWASIWWPSSQARVTSTKSVLSLRFSNVFLTKSFHCGQSFSDILQEFTNITDGIPLLLCST